jgi:hypothetical protein
MRQDQLLINSRDGRPTQSLYLSIINRQMILMLRAASEFGFRVEARQFEKEPDLRTRPCR